MREIIFIVLWVALLAVMAWPAQQSPTQQNAQATVDELQREYDELKDAQRQGQYDAAVNKSQEHPDTSSDAVQAQYSNCPTCAHD